MATLKMQADEQTRRDGGEANRLKQMNRKNYFASAESGNEELVKAALQQLARIAKADGAEEAWLVGNSKDDLDNGIVANALGNQISASLKAGRRVNLSEECQLQFFSAQTLPSAGLETPVLACWPSPKLMDKLDAVTGVSSLIVLPWTMNDIQAWLDAFGAEDILGNTNARQLAVTNPVVERALESIRLSINISTGLNNPSDRDRVIEAFRLLRDGGEKIDPTEVRAWLRRNGLEAGAADEVFQIASDPSKKKRASSTKHWRADVLKVWQGQIP